MLQTPEAVIQRTGVDRLPAYEDLGPMTDCPGFFAFRRFPPGNPLAQVTTRDGRPAVRCLVQFAVIPPKGTSVISPVEVSISFSRRWQASGRIWSTRDLNAYDPPDDNAPSPAVGAIFARAPKPISDIGFPHDFTYDNREDVFRNDRGDVVAPEQILERLCARYFRTCSLGFRIRWQASSALRWLLHKGVWQGQNAAMWALVSFYDIELTDEDLRWPFHQYNPQEFRRATANAEDRSQFFGFQSSRKSFVTNLVVVTLACVAAYWILPHTGLLRAVYNSTALTTAALGFAFVIADLLGPKLLIWSICLLSRLRRITTPFTRKVPV
jgi:hypothetical protein